MSTATSRRPPGSATVPSRKPTLADLTGKSSGLPNRYIAHGGEGTGKTSFAAYTPNPVFIQTRGETGLDTLIGAGRLPEIAHWPETQDCDRGPVPASASDPHHASHRGGRS